MNSRVHIAVPSLLSDPDGVVGFALRAAAQRLALGPCDQRQKSVLVSRRRGLWSLAVMDERTCNSAGRILGERLWS